MVLSLSGYHNRQARCLASDNPNAETPNRTRTRHLGSTIPWDPTLPHQPQDFAYRRFATPNLLPLETPNTGVPLLRILCLLSTLGPTVSIKSGNRPSRFKCAWDSCLANPDSPMCDGSRSFVRLWLKPLAAPSRSNDPQNLVSLLDDSQVADSPPLGRVLSSATLLRCSLHRVDFSRSSRLSLPSFVSGFSQRAFTCSTHPSIFDHSPSVEILPGSVHLRVQPSSTQTCY